LTEEFRRNSYQVMKDLLLAAQAGAVKTALVYRANSNWKHIRAYMDDALKKGLLEERDNRYYTTPKGEQFILFMLDLEAMLA